MAAVALGICNASLEEGACFAGERVLYRKFRNNKHSIWCITN